MALYPHPDALVALRGIDLEAMHPELRLELAESDREAALQIWRMRAADLERNPSERTLERARWAAEDLRDADADVEAARKAAQR